LKLGPYVLEENRCLAPLTTLRAGGGAEYFFEAHNLQDLAGICAEAQLAKLKTTILGGGSNVLPSDQGVEGLVVLNRATKISVAGTGEVLAETGCAFQELFLKTAQAGLKGLEYAVGIPGSLGGALVSNAGAYRSSVSEFIEEIEIVEKGERTWVAKESLEFSYRDSKLRKEPGLQCALLRVRMRLAPGDLKKIYDEAREYQRQRIGKQPPQASAGSFFKNVNDPNLVESLANLPEGLKKAGVVPAGFLIETVGLKGFRMGRAMFGSRHANFVLNVGGATAREIRDLAEYGALTVEDQLGVKLEEEVLYLGEF
jgi:UDP-N-acetylmuramate dehydrogenase